MKKIRNFLISFIETLFVIFYLLFEELVYDNFAKPIINWYKKLKIFEKLTNYLKHVNRYVILFIFLSVFVIAELLGLLSLVLISFGNPVTFILGFLVYGLKIPVGAFAIWLFKETKEQILSFKSMEFLYNLLIQFINWLHKTEIYIKSKNRILKVKEKFKEFKKDKKGYLKVLIKYFKLKYKYYKDIIKNKS